MVNCHSKNACMIPCHGSAEVADVSYKEQYAHGVYNNSIVFTDKYRTKSSRIRRTEISGEESIDWDNIS